MARIFSRIPFLLLALLLAIPMNSRSQAKRAMTIDDLITAVRVGDPALSPDGKRASVSVMDVAQQTRDIWLIDLTRGLRTRFTFDPAEEQLGVWSPD